MPLLLKPWIDDLTIKTSSTEYRKFDVNYIDPDPTMGDWGWAQRPFLGEIERQYNAGKPVRIIVLKARQLGISTASEAVLFLWVTLFHRGSNAVVISHTDGQAQELYQMTRLYWETWPHRHLFTEQYKTRRQLRWKETGSQIRVATAKNVEGLRGSTVQALHGSEVAFWPDPETLWTGLESTIPERHGTIAVLESTANGVGNWFHEAWEDAENGESKFTPLFFPWFKHSANRLRNTLHTVDLGMDERELLRLMQSEFVGEDDALASLAWRRDKLRSNSLEQFHQEQPSTPHEAFVTSGNPIFGEPILAKCFEELTGARGLLQKSGNGSIVFQDNPDGDLVIFKLPSRRDVRPDKYFVSADPSENRHAGDPACIQVINRSTNEQVAVWHSHADPVVVARQMMLVGDFYHHAMLCPEVEGGGQATIGAIMQAEYGNVWSWKKPDRTTASFNVWGWSTNYNTKLWAITLLRNLFNSGSVLIHDKRTYNELLNFVERTNGTLGNSANSDHDDTVMALAIAVCASQREGHFRPNRPVRHQDLFSTEFDQPALDDMAQILPMKQIREGRQRWQG